MSRAVLDAAMTEAQLFESVRDHLNAFGWLWVHHYDSRRSNAGFPDIVATKDQQLLFIELKREGKMPTDKQMEWLNALYYGVSHVTGAVDVHVWRPHDLSDGTIERVLSRVGAGHG